MNNPQDIIERFYGKMCELQTPKRGELRNLLIQLLDEREEYAREKVEEAFDRLVSLSMEPGGFADHKARVLDYMFPPTNDPQ